MKEAILIIAHHSIVPGAYKGFEEILDRLHHELPEARVSSTSLLDLENDLRAILSEGAESVTLLPYLLLNGRHAKNDVPETIARVQADFPDREISLLPCVGDWNAFADMVVSGLRAFRREKRALREEKNASSSSVSPFGVASIPALILFASSMSRLITSSFVMCPLTYSFIALARSSLNSSLFTRFLRA